MADPAPPGRVGRVAGERVYEGRTIALDVDRVRFPGGSVGTLEVVRHPGAAAVVALDFTSPGGKDAGDHEAGGKEAGGEEADGGRGNRVEGGRSAAGGDEADGDGSDRMADGGDPSVLLVQQYRYAAQGFIWEVPAGKLEPGESPDRCAMRELEEEAGVRAGRVEKLASIFTTPGFTDEVIHLFVALDLRHGRMSHEPGEFMAVHRIPLSRTMEMVMRGEIRDAKSICALTLASRWIGTDAG